MDLHLWITTLWVTLHVMCQASQSFQQSAWGGQNAGRQLVLDPMRICKKTRRLKSKQNQICKEEPDIVHEIKKGAIQATKECTHQFRNRRWNCTTATLAGRKSMRKVLMRDTRETAFVNAITAAGVTYAITEACSTGQMLDCSCHRLSRHQSTISGEFDWRGCSDNIDYGYRKGKEFMEEKAAQRKRGDVKTLILAHNYEAGRLAVKNHMHTACKCHGMSGSCTLKTCWKKLPLLREVGNRLKEKFDGATKVMAGNDGKGFVPDGEIKPPSKEDLVYLENSDDFCLPNKRTGSLGTKGRECNATSMSTDGCELMCCGRGYTTVKVYEKSNCNCRFKYCCEVICEPCTIKREIHRCL